MNQSHFEEIACDACSSKEYAVLYPPRYEGARYEELQEKFKSSGDETLIDQVVRCKRCDLIYVNPRVKAPLVLNGYAEGEDQTFVSQAKAREKTFGRCLKVVEKFWGRGERGRLLDIGTAGGSFLHVAQKKGWEVYGCELNRWLCDWGKKNYGLSIEAKEIFDLNYPEGFFDVITLWDVLEHTPSPRRVIEKCRQLLRPGGMLVVNYPDIGSWISKCMGRKWVFLLSVHLYYFTRASMRKLLHHHHFHVQSFRPHFQQLEVGYIFKRMQATLPRLGQMGAFVVSKLHQEHRALPYWMGQTLVISRKQT